MKFTKDLLEKMYIKMQVARKFDLKVNKLVRRDFVQGMTHFSVGQEATACGMIIQMEKDDILLSTHRGHAHCIVKDMDINKMMAELAGKVTGVSKGKGGSMHLADIEKGIYGTNGIVAANFPIGVGVAFSMKYKKQNNFVLAISGDGSTNEGAFHEAMNMAAIWKLPIIFFIENNKYGISMDINNAINTKHIYTRADAYNMKSFFIEDGNNVLDVYETSKKAIDYVKKGNGPVLIEAVTYRWFGHSTADPGIYRTKEEVDMWKEKDPVVKFENYLLENKIFTKEFLQKIEDKATQDVENSVEFAKKSPFPTWDIALEDIY